MSSASAWWMSFTAINHWAFLLISTGILLIMASCKPGLKDNRLSEEICHLNGSLELDEELNKAALRCHRPNSGNAPVLYAHYLAPSTKVEICTDDLVEDSGGAINCAPGPVLLAHGNAVGNNDRDWILNGLPDYFAWHLDGKTSVDEMIYIANANGFPIRSQSIKLENAHESALVLFPKTVLAPGTKYYLYLVRTTASKTERWIQRIVTIAKNEAIQ